MLAKSTVFSKISPTPKFERIDRYEKIIGWISSFFFFKCQKYHVLSRKIKSRVIPDVAGIEINVLTFSFREELPPSWQA